MVSGLLPLANYSFCCCSSYLIPVATVFMKADFGSFPMQGKVAKPEAMVGRGRTRALATLSEPLVFKVIAYQLETRDLKTCKLWSSSSPPMAD